MSFTFVQLQRVANRPTLLTLCLFQDTNEATGFASLHNTRHMYRKDLDVLS
jgi:hypothetical protein